MNHDNLYEVPEEELQRRGIGHLPSTLREAAECLSEDEVVKDALGKTYGDYYVNVKREEWQEYHLNVSEWERERYLPIY
jgi:glutamine synthetase